MRYYLFFLMLFISVYLNGQDLRTDKEFFNGQMEKYQRWLDHTGLGELISVRELEVEKEKLSLYLEFPFSNVDSVIAGWNRLKLIYEKESTLLLEQALFYKMLHFMELNQSQGIVAIYNTYDLLETPLFFRGIYFESGKVNIAEDNPRAKPIDVNIPIPSLRNKKNVSVTQLRKEYSKEKVFDFILQFANEKYLKTECLNRFPKIDVLENDVLLRFKVNDLCREVLTDAAQPTLCRILRTFGKACNWVKRERLEFICTFEELEKGFNIHIELEGFYGDGRRDNVPRGAYYSMEVDFDEYLEDYASKFGIELKKYILNGRP